MRSSHAWGLVFMSDRFHCSCGKRFYWCRYCDIQHCSTCSPHPPRRLKYKAKNVIVRTKRGTRTISLRQLTTLQGNSKGGQMTATRPNSGRFTTASGRKAAQHAWKTCWRALRAPGNDSPPIRIGRARKYRPAVDRAAARARYSGNQVNGVWFDPEVENWYGVTDTPTYHCIRRITERTALRRLGHLAYPRKYWQPDSTDTVVKVVTGITSASTRPKRK